MKTTKTKITFLFTPSCLRKDSVNSEGNVCVLHWKDQYKWWGNFRHLTSHKDYVLLLWSECVCLLTFLGWNLTSNALVLVGWAFRRWIGPEGGTLMNGTSTLIREAREIPHPFHHGKTPWEGTCLKPRKGPASELHHAGTRLQNCETQIVPSTPWYFVIAACPD